MGDEEEKWAIGPEERHGAIAVDDGASGGRGFCAVLRHIDSHFVDHLTDEASLAEAVQASAPAVEQRLEAQ